MHSPKKEGGFTLVELLVSTALLTGLMLILVSILDQTQKTWRFTRTKVEQFSGARAAFESMTRRLSQATLNTYWAYEYPNDDPSKTPTKYVRQSELRFLSWPMRSITTPALPPPEGITGEARATHGVFFHAPLGFVEEARFKGLVNLLNTWGYFVEFNSDATFRPTSSTSWGASRRQLEIVSDSWS
jgi:uncharacterized protein (TIGR02599 family)